MILYLKTSSKMKNNYHCIDVNAYNIQYIDINFFKELYNLMNKYNIHRIYTAYVDKQKIIVAEQLLDAFIGTSKVTFKIYSFIEDHLNWLYLNVFFKNYIYRYKYKLKKLFNKYNVEKIKPTSFNLFQGIYISENILCIREIDLVFKDGNIFHIDSLKLNI